MSIKEIINHHSKVPITDWLKEVISFIGLVSSAAQKFGEFFL
jgi:hypothetical protein